MPYLTPDSAPTARVCRMLEIPDDKFWMSLVTGALTTLLYEYNFEQFGTATPEEVVAVFQSMLDGFYASDCTVNNYIIGEVKLLATGAVPSGWLDCRGQAVSRITYADLFAAIGTIYGAGDGSTTFNVPNTAAKFIAGYDFSTQQNNTGFKLGEYGGEEKHALTEEENAPHAHVERGYVSGATTPARPLIGGFSGSVVNSPLVTGLSGSGVPHENRPPWVVFMVVIYTGV